MGKSLLRKTTNNTKCCASKSLTNASRSITPSVVETSNISQFFTTNTGDSTSNTTVIGDDSLTVADLIVFNLIEASNANITGSIDIGGGQLELLNNTISSNTSILIQPTNEVVINPNLRVIGQYTILETQDTKISDHVPVIGYQDPLDSLVLDNDDRGFEFNCVTEDNGNFFLNRSFFGLDKSRNRWVFWDNAVNIPNTKNYFRNGANLNEIDLDTIRTTLIRNPDYFIGGNIPLNITIDADDKLNMVSNTESHTTNSYTSDVSNLIQYNIGLPTISNTGRFLVRTVNNLDIIDGDKSRIELNNTLNGDGPGLYLKHPSNIEIETCDFSSNICIKSLHDLKLEANDNIVITTNSLQINTGNTLLVNNDLRVDGTLEAINLTNDVAASRFIFTESIFPFEKISYETSSNLFITAPANNAGVLYLDNDIIKGVRDAASAGDILVYNGTEPSWSSSTSGSLQNVYNSGNALNTFGNIELNNIDGRINIFDNSNPVDRINGILFQVGSPNIFSLSNQNFASKVIFGSSTSPTNTTIYIDNTNVDEEAIQIFDITNTNLLKVVPNSSINKQIQINSNTLTNSLGFNPVSSDITFTNTLWRDSIDDKLSYGLNNYVALSPKNISTQDSLIKITNGTTNILEETGIQSFGYGNMFIPNELISTSSENKVAADRLIFNSIEQPISTSNIQPTSLGGVLYFDGTNIATVVDDPNNGDILFYNNNTIEWSPISGVATMQDTYVAFDNFSIPAIIELSNSPGKIQLKDTGLNDILFQITGPLNENYFNVSSIDPVKPNVNIGQLGENICLNLYASDNLDVPVLVVNNTLGSLMEIYDNPSDGKHVNINGNIDLDGTNCVNGLEFNTQITNPFITNPTNTMWYDTRFIANDRPITTAPTIASDNAIYKIENGTNDSHILVDTGITSENAGELIVPNKLTACDENNDVAANKLIFDTIYPTTNTPLVQGSILYSDGTNITGTTQQPSVGQVLVFNGTDLAWAPPTAATLQNVYNSGSILGSFGTIELNSLDSAFILKNNLNASLAINGLLFSVSDSQNNQYFSIDSNGSVAVGENGIGRNLTLFGDDITPNISAFNVRKASDNSNVIQVTLNPLNQKHINITGNVAVNGNICDVHGVTFDDNTTVNPGIDVDRTIWYNNIDGRFVVGNDGSGMTNLPIALTPTLTNDNSILKTKSGFNHSLEETGLISPNNGELIVPAKLTANNASNDVAASSIIVDSVVYPLSITSGTPTNGDILSFNNGSFEVISSGSIGGPTTLQFSYINSTGGIASIKLNNTNGKILIKDNDSVGDAISGTLFQISGPNFGIIEGNNYFSVNNANSTNPNINFGESGDQSVIVTIYGDDTTSSNTTAFEVEGRINNTKYFQVIPSPINNRNVRISGNMSVDSVIADTIGIEFGGTLFNPFLSINTRTLWLNSSINKLLLGNNPLTLLPSVISTPNSLFKINNITDNIIEETGLTSDNNGELIVPNKLTATNTTNEVSSNAMIFNNINYETMGVPSGNSSILYIDGSNVNITSSGVNGDVLTHDGVKPVWTQNIKRISYMLSSGVTLITSPTYTTLFNFPWVASRHNIYTDATLIFHFAKIVSDHDINVRITDTSATIYNETLFVAANSNVVINFPTPSIDTILFVQFRHIANGTTLSSVIAPTFEFNYV